MLNTLFPIAQPTIYCMATLEKIPTIICNVLRFEYGSIPRPSNHMSFTLNYKIKKLLNYKVHFALDQKDYKTSKNGFVRLEVYAIGECEKIPRHKF
jgi:hypothetical protein